MNIEEHGNGKHGFLHFTLLIIQFDTKGESPAWVAKLNDLETWDLRFVVSQHATLWYTLHVGRISSSKRPKITPDMLRLPRYWKLCEGQVPRSKTGPNLSAEGDLVQDVINHPSKSSVIEGTEWEHNALVKLQKCFVRLEAGPLWLSNTPTICIIYL